MRSSARSRSSFQPANASRAGATIAYCGTPAVSIQNCACWPVGHRQRGVARLVDGLAGEDGDVAGLVEAVEAIAADGLDAKAPFVGDHLELAQRLRVAQARRDAAAAQAHAVARVVEARDLDLGGGVEAKRRRAEGDLGARAVVGGDAVAGRQRAVARDRRPTRPTRCCTARPGPRPRSGAPPGSAGRRRTAPAPTAPRRAPASAARTMIQTRPARTMPGAGNARAPFEQVCMSISLCAASGASPSLRRLLQRPGGIDRRPGASGDTFLYNAPALGRAGGHDPISRPPRHRARGTARW